jgi:hypothetical protein
MCRRFSVGIKVLAGNRFVLQTIVSTALLDGRQGRKNRNPLLRFFHR